MRSRRPLQRPRQPLSQVLEDLVRQVVVGGIIQAKEAMCVKFPECERARELERSGVHSEG